MSASGIDLNGCIHEPFPRSLSEPANTVGEQLFSEFQPEKKLLERWLRSDAVAEVSLNLAPQACLRPQFRRAHIFGSLCVRSG
jgi:hypothetical protein